MEAVNDTMGDAKKSSEDSVVVVAPIKSNSRNWCEICSMWIKSNYSVKDHEAGKPHQNKLVGQQRLLERSKEYENVGSGLLHCKLCNVKMNSPNMMKVHLDGAKHMIQVKKQMKMESASAKNAADTAAALPVEEYSGKPKIMCDICDCLIIDDPGKIASHCEGAKHIKKVASNKFIDMLKKEEDCFEQDLVSGVMRCSLCNLDLETPNHLKMHFSGAKHKTMVEGRAVKRKYEDHSNNIQPTKRYNDYYNNTPTNPYDHYYNNTPANNPYDDFYKNTTANRYNEYYNNIPNNRLGENPGYEDRPLEIKNPDCTVEIRNLPFQTQKKDIYDVFENCGKIEDMFSGFTTSHSKKMWYLVFKEREAAVDALKKNEAVFQESVMYVSAYHKPEENAQKINPVNSSINDYAEKRPMNERLDHNRSRIPKERWNYNQSRISEERWDYERRRVTEERANYEKIRMLEERGNYEQRRMPEGRWHYYNN